MDGFALIVRVVERAVHDLGPTRGGVVCGVARGRLLGRAHPQGVLVDVAVDVHSIFFGIARIVGEALKISRLAKVDHDLVGVSSCRRIILSVPNAARIVVDEILGLAVLFISLLGVRRGRPTALIEGLLQTRVGIGALDDEFFATVRRRKRGFGAIVVDTRCL